MKTSVLSVLILALAASASAEVQESRHQQELREHYHHLSYIADFSCHHPQPRTVPVTELLSPYQSRGKAYFPEYTVLHRCDVFSGCCEGSKKCGPLHADNVHLPFKVTYLEEMGDKHKGEWEMEYVHFDNHTICGCVDHLGLFKPEVHHVKEDHDHKHHHAHEDIDHKGQHSHEEHDHKDHYAHGDHDRKDHYAHEDHDRKDHYAHEAHDHKYPQIGNLSSEERTLSAAFPPDKFEISPGVVAKFAHNVLYQAADTIDAGAARAYLADHARYSGTDYTNPSISANAAFPKYLINSGYSPTIYVPVVPVVIPSTLPANNPLDAATKEANFRNSAIVPPGFIRSS